MDMDVLSPVLLSDPVNRNHPLNQGKVAWYLTLPGLDGGKYFYDLMGLNPGTLTNFSSSYGWRGTTRKGGWGQLNLDGSSSYVLIGSAAALSFVPQTNAFSVLAWVFATSAQSTNNFFVGKGDSGSGGVNQFCIGAANSGKMVSAIGQNIVSNTGTTNICDGAWHRIAVTVPASSTGQLFYVDGLVDSFSSGAGGTGSGTTTDNILLGARYTLTNSTEERFWSGNVDDVAFYSRVLSAAEISADYEFSRRGYPDMLNRVSPRVYSFSSLSSLLLIRRRKMRAA